ncbi:hypothetical protein C8R48DRAFT_711520 [Suillus tomentosus]|nr:hypothetical protein C8R48DRAFT_711520 [Suillus tomentosus]
MLTRRNFYLAPLPDMRILLGGVKSVVGTLWKVDDNTVHLLVEAFYKKFCEHDTMDSKRAARALHGAVQLLASDRTIPLSQRIVFVHIGI